MKITTPAMSHARIAEMEDICFSDFHKDVYGYRPRGVEWDSWVNMSEWGFNNALDRMMDKMQADIALEEQREAEALESFKADLQNLMASGVGDWKAALRCMMKETEEDNVEYFLWSLGIGYAKREEIVNKFFNL